VEDEAQCSVSPPVTTLAPATPLLVSFVSPLLISPTCLDERGADTFVDDDDPLDSYSRPPLPQGCRGPRTASKSHSSDSR
jgi:hypothetical protein